MSQIINLLWKNFELLDELPYITMADSFVKTNKVWWWHWEARLYIWQSNSELSFNDFFNKFQWNCFFVKNDFLKFLEDAKYEYDFKEQLYQKNITPHRIEYKNEISLWDKSFLKFKINPQNWERDKNRYYISSDSDFYTMMRKISLPNISYLTILKLKDTSTWEVWFYFHLFLDYTYNSQNHPQLILNIEKKLQNRLLAKNISNKDRLEVERIVKSRKWQWEYRERLLHDISSCIITWVNDERLLIASHIKPWAIAEDHEKIDYLNWLTLSPTYDKLFDQWFITFTDSWIMHVSPYISPMNQKRLNLIDKQKFEFKITGREKYLEYHNMNIFKWQIHL